MRATESTSKILLLNFSSQSPIQNVNNFSQIREICETRGIPGKKRMSVNGIKKEKMNKWPKQL